MNNNKRTNKEMFEIIAKTLENENIENKNELIEFINSRIELIDKKKNTISKTEKEKIEINEKIRIEIIEFLTNNSENKYTISEIIKNDENLSNFTTQKITPIIVKLTIDNIIEKIVEKRKTFYKINTEFLETE